MKWFIIFFFPQSLRRKLRNYLETRVPTPSVKVDPARIWQFFLCPFCLHSFSSIQVFMHLYVSNFLVFSIKIIASLWRAEIQCCLRIFSCYKWHWYFIDWHLIFVFTKSVFLLNILLTMFPCRRRQNINSTWVYNFHLHICLLLDYYADGLLFLGVFFSSSTLFFNIDNYFLIFCSGKKSNKFTKMSSTLGLEVGSNLFCATTS